jgi:hypothetical protein
MSEVSDRLLAAIQESQPDVNAPTRLATVVTYSATGITVTFDGEASASTRVYKSVLVVGPGERVVMTRVGSTWVCTGSLASDSGWVNISYNAGWGTYGGAPWAPLRVRKINGLVHMQGMNQAANGSQAVAVGTLPAGFRPGVTNIYTLHSGGGVVEMYVNWTGVLQYPSNPYWGTWVSAATPPWPAEN